MPNRPLPISWSTRHLAATDTNDCPSSLYVPMDAGAHHLFLDGQGGIFNGSGAEVVTPTAMGSLYGLGTFHRLPMHI